MELQYINIKDNQQYGINFDAVIANLGYCIASTGSDNFYNHLYRTGEDLSKNVLIKFTNDEVAEILNTSIKKSKDINCSCSKNEYDLNSCYIDHISKMISSLSSYSNRKNNFVGKYFDKNNIVAFYTLYYAILRDSVDFKHLLENPLVLIAQTTPGA